MLQLVSRWFKSIAESAELKNFLHVCFSVIKILNRLFWWTFDKSVFASKWCVARSIGAVLHRKNEINPKTSFTLCLGSMLVERIERQWT